MGFFSWKTQDSKKSIANSYSTRPVFTVYMTDDKGNRWKEDKYEGYGEFGGKDYYELLAEMNGISPEEGKELRIAGIELANPNTPDKKCKHPNLTESPEWVWKDEMPETCPDQGYFYETEGEDMEDD